MFDLLAIATLAVGATLDGWSTAYAIRYGNVEVDPIMLFIFGTNRPTTKIIFLRGGLVIMAESVVTLLVGHFHPEAGRVLSLGLLGQAGYHIWATIRNFRLK